MRTVLAALALITLIVGASLPSRAIMGQENPIKHVIVVMQENRTFDHYFGTYPGANGLPIGARVPADLFDSGSGCLEPRPSTRYVEPYHLETRRTPDPPHDERISRAAYNCGMINGLLYAHDLRRFNGTIAMGYYDHREIPYYWNLAEFYVLADNFYSSVLGGSFANHLYVYAGTDDSTTGEEYGSIPVGGMELRIIFDLLEENGITWKNYVNNYDPNANYTSEAHRLGLARGSAQLFWTPPLGIPRYVFNQTLYTKIQDLSQYFLDVNSDSFPSVVYITPSFQSEHAPGDISQGQLFVVSLINSLMTSRHWWDSVLILTYDDWGGWYDHVAPPQVDEDGYGFRVPTLIVSPYAREGYIDHTVYDFTSILAMIETLFDLPPLIPGGRDDNANNMFEAFDFASPPRAPVIPTGEYPMKGIAQQSGTFKVWMAYSGMIGAVVSAPLLFVVIRREFLHVQKRLEK